MSQQGGPQHAPHAHSLSLGVGVSAGSGASFSYGSTASSQPPRLHTIGLNVHASSFHGHAIGPPSLMHFHPRPHSRKYDSEPLHSRSSGSSHSHSLVAADRFHSPRESVHSASLQSTSASSQASSRSRSRTSSLASSLPSHQHSPRAHSPNQHQHMHTTAYMSHAQQQQQQQQHIMQQQQQQQQQQHAVVHSLQQQLLSSSPSTVSPPTGRVASALPPTPPSASSAASTPVHSPASSSNSSLVSPPAGAAAGGCTCAAVAQENAQLRATLAAQSFEIRQLRTDVTKALMAFESRLLTQMAQQLGFQPDKEPMGAHALHLLQQQQQQQQQPAPQHSPSDDSNGWHSKRSSSNWSGILSPSTGSSSPMGWAAEQQGAASTSHNAPAQNPAALLTQLGLGNMSLANLSQLLNAVSSLQGNVQQANGPQQSSSLPPPSAHLTHSSSGSLLPHSSYVSHHSHPSLLSGGSSVSMTEERLIMLAIDILAVHGAVPVGKMGSLLHKAANDHTLPQLLKERYGGLKKFLSSQTQYFTLGMDHPYNPCLSLSAEFLAANPHIRPPEPALPATAAAAMANLAGTSGSHNASTTSTSSTTSATNESTSLHTPLPLASSTSSGYYFSGSSTPSLLSPIPLPRGVSAPPTSSQHDTSGSVLLMGGVTGVHVPRSGGLSGSASVGSDLALAAGGLSVADREHDRERDRERRDFGTVGVRRDSSHSFVQDLADVDVERRGSSASVGLGVGVGSPLRTPSRASSGLVSELGLGGQRSPTAAAAAAAEDADTHHLQMTQVSPILGATQASATANESFFSRLLG